MSTFYVTQAGAGLADGSSLDNAWSVADFNDVGNWGAGSIEAGSVVRLSGTFTSRLVIKASGASAANRIILVPNTTATLLGIDGGTQNYIAVIGCRFTQASSTDACIHCLGCDGWLIDGNTFEDTWNAGVNFNYNTVNSNNIVRGNLFKNVGGSSDGESGDVCINVYGHENLIEYNTVEESMDRVRCFGQRNIVRNNRWKPTDAALYPSSSPYPFHTDGFQSYGSTLLLNYLMYEANWDDGNKDSVGGTNAHSFITQDNTDSDLGDVIIRGNVLYDCGGPFSIAKDLNRVRSYNNTTLEILTGAAGAFNSAVTFEDPGGDDCVWVNNVWCDMPNSMNPAGIITTNNRGTPFVTGYSSTFNAGTLDGTNNVIDDPEFTDKDGRYFMPVSGSPLVGAARAITSAVGAGSGSTSLTVDDAKGLFDGWNVATGDTITIGAGNPVIISSIDYDTDVVTLDEARTWSDADDVVISGTSDIGAFEYRAGGYDLTLSVAQNGNDYTAIVDDDVTRMVIFSEDGIPQDPSMSSPHEYTSSGGAVTVRAFALNAADVPVIESGSPPNAPPNAPTNLTLTAL